MHLALARISALSLATVLAGCQSSGTGNPCDSTVEVTDVTTGQIRLGTGDACQATIWERRPRIVEMWALEAPPDSDPCQATSATLVYEVRELSSDLDFGPSDPPDEGVIVVDDTDTIQVGTWVDVTFWTDSAVSSSRVSIGEWSYRFQWGVEGSGEGQVSCGISGL